MPATGIEPVREYKSRRILSPVRLPVPPLRHTRQIAPTPLESRASMRSIVSHFVITLLANHDNLLSRNGTNRARTYDPLLVRQMLSQLSYDPKYSKNKATRMGIEPTTSAVTGRRSNQLSHRALYIKDIPSKQHTRIFLHLLHFSLLWLKPRPISNSQLHTLPYFHLCPIYLVVFKGSYYLSVWEILSLGGLHA